MRSEGMSYGEIRKVFGIPKSTLSGWLKNLEVNGKAKVVLQKKQRKGLLMLAQFNKERTALIKGENEQIRKEHSDLINNLSERDMMIIGAALYWGEGYKNFGLKRGGYPHVEFGNSDPEMILVFMVFLQKFLGISKKKIKCQVMIYPATNPSIAVDYWQRLTKIPKENFRYQVALSRSSQQKRPKNMLPHGTLQLRVSRRQEFFKIRGLIDGIIKSI